MFRAAGYKTSGIGKWHNNRASYMRAFNAGGPVFFGGMGDYMHLTVYNYGATSGHLVQRYSSALFADAAVAQIRIKRRRPFVMYVAFTAPHAPRVPPPAYARYYKPRILPLPANFTPEPPFDNGEMDLPAEQLLPHPLGRRP